MPITRRISNGKTRLALPRSQSPLAAILLGVLAVLIFDHRQAQTKIQRQAAMLDEQEARLSELSEEKRANIAAADTLPETETAAPVSAATRDIAGELERLRSDKARLEAENAALRQEDQVLGGPRVGDLYAAQGYITNDFPHVELGDSIETVRSALQNVGASIVANQDRFIRAEVLLANAEGHTVGGMMRLGFDQKGKLMAAGYSEGPAPVG